MTREHVLIRARQFGERPYQAHLFAFRDVAIAIADDDLEDCTPREACRWLVLAELGLDFEKEAAR